MFSGTNVPPGKHVDGDSSAGAQRAKVEAIRKRHAKPPERRWRVKSNMRITEIEAL